MSEPGPSHDPLLLILHRLASVDDPLVSLWARGLLKGDESTSSEQQPKRSNMMTWNDFDARWAHIEEQAGAMQERVDAYKDQESSKLFNASGRTQQEIAAHLKKKWGKSVSQPYLSRRLLFGRFLEFYANWHKTVRLPDNLTEGAFRKLWEQATAAGRFTGRGAHNQDAKDDENRRFAEVIGLLFPEPDTSDETRDSADEDAEEVTVGVPAAEAVSSASLSSVSQEGQEAIEVSGVPDDESPRPETAESPARTQPATSDSSDATETIMRALKWAAKQRNVTAEQLSEKFGNKANQWRKLLSSLGKGTGFLVTSMGEGNYRVRNAVHFHLLKVEDQPDLKGLMVELHKVATVALKDSSDMSRNHTWSYKDMWAFLQRVIEITRPFTRS